MKPASQAGDNQGQQNEKTGDLLGAGGDDETQQQNDNQQAKKEPSRKAKFEYAITNKVKIKANGCNGEVTRLLVEPSRMLYEVRYSDLNNCIHDKWFTSEEIEPA